MKACVRCQKPIPPEEHRRKFCSDACADSAARSRIKARNTAFGGIAGAKPRVLYRYYPKKEMPNDS